jgi:hypothetical protein
MNFEKMLEVLTSNLPLVAMLGTVYYAVTPRMIRSTLLNGGGEIVKGIVRACNAEQSKEHAEAIAKVRERLAALEALQRGEVK